MKKILTLSLALVLAVTTLAACGGGTTTTLATTTSTTAAETTTTAAAPTTVLTTASESQASSDATVEGGEDPDLSDLEKMLASLDAEMGEGGEFELPSVEGIQVPSFSTLAEKDMSPFQKWYKAYNELQNEAMEAFNSEDFEIFMVSLSLVGGDISMALASAPWAKTYDKAETAEGYKELGVELLRLENNGVTGITEFKDAEGLVVTNLLSFDEASGTVDFRVIEQGTETYQMSIAFKDNKLAKSYYSADGSSAGEFTYDGATKNGKYSYGASNIMPTNLYKNMAGASAADFATKYEMNFTIAGGKLQ